MFISAFVVLIQLIIFGVLIILIYYFTSMLISDLFGVPFVPTTNKSINHIFSQLKIKKSDLFFDLGCGDGRLVFFVAQKYQCRAVGVEKNPLLNWFCRAKTKILKIPNVSFLKEDLYKVNLKKATIVYLFLFPEVVEKLKPLFNRQCKSGTLVISHGFKIRGWEKKLFKIREGKPFFTYYYQI